jgi:hypothetical protein
MPKKLVFNASKFIFYSKLNPRGELHLTAIWDSLSWVPRTVFVVVPPSAFHDHRFLITPKIPPSPGKRMALSSTGKEALNQTHPRSKSTLSPLRLNPHQRSRIKINPSLFQPIQDQESKSTHLRSNPSKIKNQNKPIFVSTHSKPLFAFMGGHRPAEPGHWLMGFSPSVPSSCSLASL